MHDSPQMANKGEWSEIYVLFKILHERDIAAAGADLKPLGDQKYTFLKVLREDTPGKEYQYSLEEKDSVAIQDHNGNTIKILDSRELGSKTQRIFKAIKDSEGSSFAMPDVSALMDEYLITKVKANSSEKTDILGIILDKTGNADAKLGFSIKSHLGGAPTLVNSSSHTNFLYEVSGFDGDTDRINSTTGPGKIRQRLQLLNESGAKFKFIGISSETFKANLRYTDTTFPLLMSQMLLEYYSGNGSSPANLAKLISANEDFDVNETELTYKIKGFLRSAALGMMPSKHWDTMLNTYGGYIIVLNDGQIVCYHLFNDDEFKEYLFRNTKFDTPSTTKYKFGELFRQDGKLMLKLNLQIRFLK